MDSDNVSTINSALWNLTTASLHAALAEQPPEESQ